MTELNTVERLMLKDRQLSAAERFAQRMRQVRILNGAEVPEEGVFELPAGVRTVRLTDPLVAYIASLLEGRDDLKADTLRIMLDLPFPSETDVVAAQGQGGSHLQVTCSLSTRTTRHLYVAPFGRRGWSGQSHTLVGGLRSVALAS